MSKPMPDYVGNCEQCGLEMVSRRRKRFCSKRCRHVYTREHETRTCSAEGCDYRLWTHVAVRHRKREVACVVCATVVLRRVDNTRLDSHCCSVECRRKRQFGERVGAGVSSYSWNADAKRRAHKLGALVIEDVDRDAVMDRDGWRCYLCRLDLTQTDDPFSPASATVDHVVPLSQGGKHSMSNVRACCLSCNAAKSDRAAISPAA